jgi:hypothetical protein
VSLSKRIAVGLGSGYIYLILPPEQKSSETTTKPSEIITNPSDSFSQQSSQFQDNLRLILLAIVFISAGVALLFIRGGSRKKELVKRLEKLIERP